MKRRSSLLLLAGVLCISQPAFSWGTRAHAVIDRTAVDTLPADGPIFLKNYVDYIAGSASIPDTWRAASDPFSKIEEDPNHGWFREQFAFMNVIPRARYEFVLALYREQLRIEKSDPENARRMNVRWTGTLPYAAAEVYGHLVAAQPLHDTIHHDGWQGPDPNGYTRDPKIHGRFESQYVDAIALTEADILPRIGQPGHLQGDVFDLILAHLNEAGSNVEAIYMLDKRNAFADAHDPEAREMVYSRTAAGARMLRDLVYRAWLESALPAPFNLPNPIDPSNPLYNPQTGSAPASRSPELPR